MKKSFISTKVISEIAIFTAIAFALDFLQGGIFRGLFPNGGSIGIAMLPILLLCYRRGFVAGLISSFCLSFLQMLGGVYAIASDWYLVFLQICLDYVLAYPAVSVAGLFFKSFQNSDNKKTKIKYLVLGTTLGGLLKLLCHYLAGVIFWASSCPDGFLGGPYVYSLVYNGGFMIPNIIINALLLVLLLIKQPSIFELEKKEEATNEKQA